jgi:hypothetical protein
MFYFNAAYLESNIIVEYGIEDAGPHHCFNPIILVPASSSYADRTGF